MYLLLPHDVIEFQENSECLMETDYILNTIQATLNRTAGKN